MSSDIRSRTPSSHKSIPNLKLNSGFQKRNTIPDAESQLTSKSASKLRKKRNSIDSTKFSNTGKFDTNEDEKGENLLLSSQKSLKNGNNKIYTNKKIKNIIGIYGGLPLPKKGQSTIPKPPTIDKNSKIQEKENQQQQQFRAKNINQLQELQEQKQKEKLIREQEKLKQELKIAKMKGDVNFNYVNSKLYDSTKGSQSRANEIQQEKDKKKQPNIKDNMSEEEQNEIYKRLFQRQKNYLEKIQNKKIQEQKQQEELAQKQNELKNKMQNHVLVNIKQKIENGEFYCDDLSKKKTAKGGRDIQIKPLNRTGVNDESDQEDLENENSKLEEQSSKRSISMNGQKEEQKVVKRKLRSYPFIQDLEEWKKKQRLPSDIKVFIVSGGYGDVKKALRARGWVENPDHSSLCFDFKWTLLSKEIAYDSLKENQIVNHYSRVSGITTKVGLCKNLRNLAWFTNVNVHDFYPRCYDLTDTEDHEEFITDFKTTQAEAVIKKYINDYKDRQDFTQEEIIAVKASLRVCQRKVRELDDLIDDESTNTFNLITDEEWDIIGCNEMNVEGLIKMKHEKWLNKLDKKNKKVVKKKRKSIKKTVLTKEEKQERILDTYLQNNDGKKQENSKQQQKEENVEEQEGQQDKKKAYSSNSLSMKTENIQQQSPDKKKATSSNTLNSKKSKKSQKKLQGQEEEEDYDFEKHDEKVNLDNQEEEEYDEEQYDDEEEEEEDGEDEEEEEEQKEEINNDQIDNYNNDDEEEEISLYDQCKNMIKLLYEKFPQSCLNGEKNIWILKPASSSRGRGIICYNTLIEIQDHVKAKEFQWVAQKYIENPLIIDSRRKFDIRVWVLISDWNPLVIWYFQEVYIRMSAQDYTTDDLKNRYQHLTNNSISKKNKKYGEIFGSGNMYTQEEFQQYLINTEGTDVFKEKIEPKIKKAIIWSMQACASSVDHRKNSFEMYGYDFMIDDLYNTWLIEINSSPDMSYSTAVTERLVKLGLQDLVKIALDYNSAPKKKKKQVDTGMWKRIFKGAYVPEKQLNTVGLNLVIEGKKIKK